MPRKKKEEVAPEEEEKPEPETPPEEEKEPEVPPPPEDEKEEAPPPPPDEEMIEEAPPEEEPVPETEEGKAEEEVPPPEEKEIEEAPPAEAEAPPPEEEKPAEEEPKEEPPTEEPKEEEPPEEKPPKEEKKPPAEPGPLLFGKYDFSEVVVQDAGLARYINLTPIYIPHTGAKHANKRFGKVKMNVVERLINNTMRTENFTGKKSKAFKTVSKAFEIIEKKAKQNPIQVLVDALQNAAPREEITRLRFGGISVPRAVDIAPSRRLDIAMRNICKGAVASTHKNKKTIEACLANELMLAAKEDMTSFAITRKEELERVAASAR